jgi:hypothetical protein
MVRPEASDSVLMSFDLPISQGGDDEGLSVEWVGIEAVHV